jgi:hypothetical protein
MSYTLRRWLLNFGNDIATTYDIMVHYGHPEPKPQPPQLCTKCGSHRTQIIGRLEDGKTLIIRCNACGAHSTVVSTKPQAA